MHRYYLAGSNYHWEYLLGYNLGALTGVIILSVSTLTIIEFSASIIFLLVVSGTFWFLLSYTSFRADQNLEASISSVIEQFQLILVFCGGIIFFKEQISILKILGSSLIFLGLIVLFIKNNREKISKKGVVFKLASVLSISVALLIDKKLVMQIDASVVTLSGYFVPLILTLAIKPDSIKNVFSVAKRINWGNIWLGALGCFSFFSLIKAFKQSEISIIFPLFQSHVILIVIAGYLFLSEKRFFIQKILASMLILGGSVLITTI